MKKSIRKGDVVKYYPAIHKYKEGFISEADYGKTGIVLSIKKKEMSRNKSKHVMEIVIAHIADVMWSAGNIENEVPVEFLQLVSRG